MSSWWSRLQCTLFLMAGGQQILSMQQVKTREALEHIWAFHLATEFAGLSLLALPDGLRLLPFVVPVILTWKRGRLDPLEQMAREGGGMKCC